MPANFPKRNGFLLALAGAGTLVGNSQRGLPKVVGGSPLCSTSGILNFYRTPKSNQFFLISGVTRDGSNNPLGNCVVKLYTTADDILRYSTISNASTGAYSFSVPSNGWAYYAVAYLVGAPDVEGTTINTLLGA